MDETTTVIKIKSNRSGTISKVKWAGLLQCDRSYPVREPDWVKILIVISDLLRYNSSYKARRHGDHTRIARLAIRPVKELHW